MLCFFATEYDVQVRTMFVMRRSKASDTTEEQILVGFRCGFSASVDAFAFRVHLACIDQLRPVMLVIGPTDVAILRDRRDTVGTIDDNLVVHPKPTRWHIPVFEV